MMKLPKNYFENLSIAKYRQYLKLLPNVKEENTKAITMLIFTFIALSILGVFAINPTISTIIELQKDYDDSQFVDQQLKTKEKNLSNLQQQYTNLTDDLPFVYDAIPQTANVPTLVGQLTLLAQNSNVTVSSLQVSPVTLSDAHAVNSVESFTSFTFSLDGSGSYDDIMQFIASLGNFNRIVTVENISLTKNPQESTLEVSIQGRGYFKE